MNAILKIFGSFFLLRMVLNQAANSVLSKITYNFKEVKIVNFSFFGATKVKFTYVVTNGTDIPVTVERLTGNVTLGGVNAVIDAPQVVELKPGGTAIINFTIEVQNDDFLLELGEIVERRSLPEIFFRGTATVRIAKDQTVNLPISQKIPVVLA